jgi:hypothetical protein
VARFAFHFGNYSTIFFSFLCFSHFYCIGKQICQLTKMKAMQLSIQRARIVPATTVPLFSSVEQHLLLHRKRKLHSTSAALHGGGKCEHKPTTSGAIPWTFTPHDEDATTKAPPVRVEKPFSFTPPHPASTSEAGSADTAATAGQFERQGPAPAKQGGISSLDYCITQSKCVLTGTRLERMQLFLTM